MNSCWRRLLVAAAFLLMLLVFAYVAYQVGDTTLALWALAGVGAAMGFFVWNWPRGLIFLGAHACAKTAMFLTVGNILHAAGHDRIKDLDGITHVLPVSVFAFGLAASPALARTVDGTIKVSGKVPSVAEIKGILQQAAA